MRMAGPGAVPGCKSVPGMACTGRRAQMAGARHALRSAHSMTMTSAPPRTFPPRGLPGTGDARALLRSRPPRASSSAQDRVLPKSTRKPSPPVSPMPAVLPVWRRRSERWRTGGASPSSRWRSSSTRWSGRRRCRAGWRRRPGPPGSPSCRSHRDTPRPLVGIGEVLRDSISRTDVVPTRLPRWPLWWSRAIEPASSVRTAGRHWYAGGDERFGFSLR